MIDLTYPAYLRAKREHTKEVDLPDPVVEASMGEGSEVLVDHAVHPFNKNGVHRLEELMTWVGPLLDGLLDEGFGDNEWIIVGELSRFGPAIHLSH